MVWDPGAELAAWMASVREMPSAPGSFMRAFGLDVFPFTSLLLFVTVNVTISLIDEEEQIKGTTATIKIRI